MLWYLLGVGSQKQATFCLVLNQDISLHLTDSETVIQNLFCINHLWSCHHELFFLSFKSSEETDTESKGIMDQTGLTKWEEDSVIKFQNNEMGMELKCILIL